MKTIERAQSGKLSFEETISPKSPRHVKRDTNSASVKSSESLVSESNKKPALRKIIGGLLVASIIAGGVAAYSKYESFKKQISDNNTELAVAKALDNQGITYQSINVKSNGEIITSVPASSSNGNRNYFDFFTSELPNGQYQLYQKLTTANGDVKQVYNVTNQLTENQAIAAMNIESKTPSIG